MKRFHFSLFFPVCLCVIKDTIYNVRDPVRETRALKKNAKTHASFLVVVNDADRTENFTVRNVGLLKK